MRETWRLDFNVDRWVGQTKSIRCFGFGADVMIGPPAKTMTIAVIAQPERLVEFMGVFGFFGHNAMVSSHFPTQSEFKEPSNTQQGLRGEYTK